MIGNLADGGFWRNPRLPQDFVHIGGHPPIVDRREAVPEIVRSTAEIFGTESRTDLGVKVEGRNTFDQPSSPSPFGTRVAVLPILLYANSTLKGIAQPVSPTDPALPTLISRYAEYARRLTGRGARRPANRSVTKSHRDRCIAQEGSGRSRLDRPASIRAS